jgi:hypothetical protein
LPENRYASAEEWRAAVVDALRSPAVVTGTVAPAAPAAPASAPAALAPPTLLLEALSALDEQASVDGPRPVGDGPAVTDSRRRSRRRGWLAPAALGALAVVVLMGLAFRFFPGGGPVVSVTGPDLLYTGDPGAWVAVSDRPATFTWTVVPNGIVRSGAQLVYTPTASGPIVIELAAVGEDGEEARIEINVDVRPGDSDVRITGPALVTVGQTVVLAAEAPDGAVTTWVDWRDERHSGPTLTFRPTSAGLLAVELRASVDGDVHTAQRTITVVVP